MSSKKTEQSLNDSSAHPEVGGDNVVEGPWKAEEGEVSSSQPSEESEVPDGFRRWRRAFFNPIQVWSEASQRIGETAVQAGQNIESGSRKLRSVVPAVGDLIPLAQQVRQAGESMLRTPGGVAQAAGHLGGHLTELGQEGKKVMESVANLDLPGALKGARDMVGKGVGTLVDYGSALGGIVVEKVDFNKQIDQLNDGDHYTISLGGDLQTDKTTVLGLQGFADGQIAIWRQGDEYVVAVDGQLAAGIHPSGGTGLGLTLKAEVEAKVGAGVTVEMTFPAAEQAKRATRSLLQMSVIAGASLASGIGGVVTFPMGAMLSPSEEDMQSMRESISAVEVSGMLAAQLGGSVGLGTQTIDLVGLFGEVDAGAELAARIEVFPDQPPVVALKQTTFVGGSIHMKAGISITEETGHGRQMVNPEQLDASMSLGPGGIELSVGLGGALQGKVTVENRIQLPSEVPTRSLLSSPLSTLQGIASNMLSAVPGRISVLVRAGGLAMTRKSGLETSFVMNGSLLPLLQSGAVQRALAGEFIEAIHRLGDHVQLEASIRPYLVSGHTLNPSVKVGGIGVGLQGGLTGVDYQPPLWEYSGLASSLTENLETKLREVLQLIRDASAQLSTHSET